MRRPRTALIAGGGVFLIVLALGLGATADSDYLTRARPAPPETLERIKARNEKAAAESAARMRAESEQQAEAADAAQAGTEAAAGR
jgi:hypothetical protein